MSNLKGKRILILQQRRWGEYVGSFLADQLEKEGCILTALTLKRTTDKHIREETKAHYETIVGNDVVMEDPLRFLGNDRYSMQEICDDLGIDTIWPIVITLRNHVRSYGEKYYYSYYASFQMRRYCSTFRRYINT
jgi:hypothetical protein